MALFGSIRLFPDGPNATVARSRHPPPARAVYTSIEVSMNKKFKKDKWQIKKEAEASKNSQFDPNIHVMSKNGIGFQMKRGYKATPEELSGAQLKHMFDKPKQFWKPKKDAEDI